MIRCNLFLYLDFLLKLSLVKIHKQSLGQELINSSAKEMCNH